MREILIAALVIIIIAIIYIYVFISSRPNRRRRTFELNAKVIKKEVDKWKNDVISPTVTDYNVIFEREDGKLLELKIPQYSDYERLNVGMYGKLLYQKNKLFKIFVSFNEIGH